ncbi:MAG: GGDEF domain-containing protein [Candidatus Acidiferrales bacterium]
MSQTPPSIFTQPADPYDEAKVLEIQSKLRKVERRDWWLWTTAVAIMLLLTFAVFSLSFPGLIKVEDPFFQASLNRAVRGLIELVLLFNAYTIYQQITLKRLRKQFFEQLEGMRALKVQAEQNHLLAMIDPLTGLNNRRAAEARLVAEASRSRRNGNPLTVVSFDLNNFKQINDTYGHPAGDLVLKEFAARLKLATRLSDIAARMGGDEFLVLLPDCPIDQVDHLISRLDSLEITYNNQGIPFHFSAGWVGYQRGETTEQFLERADRTLYAEKRAGKLRVGEPATVR